VELGIRYNKLVSVVMVLLTYLLSQWPMKPGITTCIYISLSV